MLVGLLIYPLRKHNKEKGRLTLRKLTNRPSEKDVKQNARRKTQNQPITHRSGTNQKINMILRRTVCFSITVVVGNMVSLVVSTYGFTERRIYIMLYVVVTFANLAFVVSSMGGWRRIVCLPCSVTSGEKLRSLRATFLKRRNQIKFIQINDSNDQNELT